MGPSLPLSDSWLSIIALMSDTGSFKLPFWNALQLHHFFNSIPNPQRFNRSLTSFEEYCSDEGTWTQVLSKTYTLLNTPSDQPYLPFMQKLETELH